MAHAYGLSSRQKGVTLGGALLAMLLAALDQTVVTTAGPAIQQALGVAPAHYAWMTTAYLVTATVLVPVSGRLCDLWGRKPVMVAGILVFVAASGACGCAQTPLQLIAFRGLQGAGTAAIFTTTFAIVGDLYPAAERGKYSGLLASVFGVASLVGPLAGGLLTDQLGWRWVFLINLPVGAVALALVVATMPRLAPAQELRPALDLTGTGLLALGVVPMLLGCSLGRSVLREGDLGWPWLSWPIGGLFAVALAGTAAFIAWEVRVKEPLLELSLFRDPTVALGSAATFVLGAVLLTPMLFLPLYLEHVVGVSATASGLTVSPLVLGTVAGNLLSGQVVSRVGHYKALMLAALGLLAVGLAVVGFTLTPESSQGEVTLKMVLLGLGLGPTIPLYTLAIQHAVEPIRLGVATSVVTFFRQMGATVGIAIAGSLFATTLSTRVDAALREATAGLPAAQVERFTGEGGGLVPAGEGDPLGHRFDAAQVKERLSDQLQGARAFAERALAGEFLAARLVAANPLAGAPLKEAAEAGGVKALVHRRLAALAARLEEVPAQAVAWETVLASPDLPEGLRQQWRLLPVESLREADTRARLKVQLEEAEAPAAVALHARLTAELDASLATARPRLFAVVDQVGEGLKVGFTEATVVVFRAALGLVLLALLLTLRLPRRSLHVHVGTPPPT